MFPPSLCLSFFSLLCSIPRSQKKTRSNATTISFMSHIFVSYLSNPTLLQSREDMSPDFLLKVLKRCLSYVRLRFCWKFIPHVSNSVSVFRESNRWPQLYVSRAFLPLVTAPCSSKVPRDGPPGAPSGSLHPPSEHASQSRSSKPYRQSPRWAEEVLRHASFSKGSCRFSL